MIVGIDIGGTSSKLGLVDNGHVLEHLRIPTKGHTDPGAFADALADGVRQISKDVELKAVGIGAPNGNQRTGMIENPPNLPWFGNIPLADMLRDRLGVSCRLGNDASAAALGAWKFGAGRGYTDIIVVTLGTGLGSGIISEGRLLMGPHGNAGELGHTNLVIDGRPCTCGLKGCLETYVSIRGIRQTYKELCETPDILETAGVKPISDAAHAGDNAALQTFTHTARWLAAGLATATALFAPQKIILFGGIARNGDVLSRPLKAFFEEFVMPMHRGKIEIDTSSLPDDDAAILGAAAMSMCS